MGFFTSSKSSTNYSTTNNYTDQSVNAGEGAIAADDGSNIHIEQVSDNIALGALASNENVSRTALLANRDVNVASLDTTSGLARSAINSVQSMAELAAREKYDTLNASNLAIQNNQGLANRLADIAASASERAQTAPETGITKQLLWIVGGVLALFGVLVLFASRSRRK